MSLQITHIRFALDLHKELNITSLDQYISGTIYPDSRYMTGIDRSLTHSDTLLTQFDSEDQFVCGMAVHYLCDKVTNKIRSEWFDMPKQDGTQQHWDVSTAMKIIQNIQDFKLFDAEAGLAHLTYINPRNNEDPEQITYFYETLQKLHAGKRDITIDDERAVWAHFISDISVFDRAFSLARKFENDKEMVSKIHAIYDESLKRARQLFS